MDFEQFCPKVVETKCEDCGNLVRGVLVVMTFLALLIDCISSCKNREKMNTLKAENESLKSIILKSVDRALIKAIKPDEDDD